MKILFCLILSHVTLPTLYRENERLRRRSKKIGRTARVFASVLYLNGVYSNANWRVDGPIGGKVTVVSAPRDHWYGVSLSSAR